MELKDKKLFLLDMDGTIYLDNDLFDGTLDFLQEVKSKGEYIMDKLLKMPHVSGCDGMGLMIGVRLDENVKSADVVKKGIGNGVLSLTAKAKLRLLPPLTITYEEIDEGLSAIEKALNEL